MTYQETPCAICGEPILESPYSCASEEHYFCQQCVEALNDSPCHLNCPFDDGALVT
jgi:hypothetical protein